MKKIVITKLLPILLVSGAILSPGISQAAEAYPMDAKLQQCEVAFKAAHSGKLTVAESNKARQEHMKLVMEILQNLNQRNTEVDTTTGESLTQKEIVNNFRVMGRLLEMLAVDHQEPKVEWNYAY